MKDIRVEEVKKKSELKKFIHFPWTENEMKHMARKFKQFADPNIVILAENKGKPVELNEISLD